MPGVQEVFDQLVRPLPIKARIQLAALILEDLARSEIGDVDASGAWSEEDERDLTAFSLHYAESVYPQDQELA